MSADKEGTARQAAQLPEDVRGYLATLRRIPVEVRQSMATREFEMRQPTTCVCGWAINDSILAATGDGRPTYAPPETLAKHFGGTVGEWDAIFSGVCYMDQLPLIETAFTIAVAETVRVPRKQSRRQAPKKDSRP